MSADSLFLAALLAAPGLAQAAPEQEPAAPRTGRVQRFRGRVVDDDFRPVAGAGFTAGAAAGIRTVDALERPLARTAADGTFDFEVAAPEGSDEALAILVAAPGKAALRWTAYIPATSLRGGAPREPVQVGDLRLPRGVELKGRVRSADGRPLAGAHVRASDLVALRCGAAMGSGLPARLLMSAATSDADGSFTLPCSLWSAVQVVADADGHYRRTRSPVSEGQPLVLELEPSATIAGAVVDDHGAPSAATVTVTYEVDHAERQTESVGPDGTFRFTLRYPCRYRVSASRKAARATTESGVLTGPQQGLELRVGKARRRALVVRAVEAATGAPVRSFRAAAYWWQVDPSYLEAQFDPLSVASEDGQVVLPEPGSDGTQAPMVRVAAEGFAAQLIDAVALRDEGDTQVEAKLRPESVARGRVLDVRTGKPVAGCEVIWRTVKPDDQNVRHVFAPVRKPTGRGVTTADDGSFSLGGLAQGTFELQAVHAARPPGKPVRITLADEETKAGVGLSIPSGATLSGRISGAGDRPGLRVRLERRGPMRGHYVLQQQQQDETGGEGVVPLAPDGGYRFEGQGPGSYEIHLLFPSQGRAATTLRVLVEELRLKARDAIRDIDVAEDLPGTVRGRVLVEGTPLPVGRWVVTATQAPDPHEQQVFFSSEDSLVTGRRALIEPDGSYELLLPVGDHRLQVVDLETGVLLAKEAEDVTVGSGERVTRDLAVRSVEVRLRLRGPDDGSYTASRLAIEGAIEPYRPQGGNMVFFGGGAATGPFELCEAPAEVSFFVPPGAVKLSAFSGAQKLFRNRNHGGPLSVGELELEAELGKVAVAQLDIDAPPEIEDEQPRDGAAGPAAPARK